MARPLLPRLTQSKYRCWIITSVFILLPILASTQTRVSYSAPNVGGALKSYADVVARAQEDQALRLELGKPIERELAGGQSHSYQLSLASGQYVKLVVEQRGIDVLAQLSGPDGKLITEFNSESRTQGQEMVEQVAEAECVYKLKVRPMYEGAADGKYQIRIEELRNATDIDRALQQARELHTESRRLYFASRYDDALPALERALELREKALGPEHPMIAANLNNLASLYRNKGAYAKAESLHHRARTIWEKTLGPEDPNVAISLNNLGILYQKNKGDYAKAEQSYQRALAINGKALGPEHPNVAINLHNLADLYHDRGDYVNAESVYRRVLAIREKALGPEDPDVAGLLTNLAELNRDRGDYANAEQLHQRALTIYEKSLGPEDSTVAMAFNNLATLSRDRGDFAKAELLYHRAQAIWGKAPGQEHPLFADSLNELAILYRKKGEYEKAEQLHQRAQAIFEKAAGQLRSMSLRNLAILYAAKGAITQAISFQSRANAISERNLALNLAIGSERQKLAYLALFSKQTDFTLSLHSRAAPNDQQALNLAFTTLLRRKGRGLDATTDMIAALRRHATPQDQAVFDQLSDARSRLATLTFIESGSANPDTYRARLKPLEEEVEKLEAELGARSADYRAQTQPVTLAAVQSALPADSVLVEVAVHIPQELQTEKNGPPRYLAYLLAAQGQPKWVDLGEAAPIDRAITAWRQALRDPRRKDVKRLARVVDEKVMRPVRASVQSEMATIRRLLIAPDGLLNLVPFAALVDQQGRYLVERYSISYLMSGRDLLRLRTRPPGKQGVVVVAHPDYGEMAGAVESRSRDVGLPPGLPQSAGSSFDQAQIYFLPLEGTAGEARALKTIMPQATVFTGEQATEAALKRLSSPSILHVATHGFFLRDQELGRVGTRDVGAGAVLSGPLSNLPMENPLLRSGLALAGANLRRSRADQEDDGILTALEAAGLDLWGTKLVVLSACDTGVGEVKNGEGVYGLRRALALAGSETQVMSLWPVSDLGARDLMIEYYQALQRGEGRSEGLRRVQLEMLKRKDRRHPFYWASFIQSGEWANLEGKR